MKLMAGLGAWIGPGSLWGRFFSTAMVGGAMGLAMMVYSGGVVGHLLSMESIGREILAIRNPTTLAERAAERKPTMLLLPYGIPIAVGTIAYLGWFGFLV